jgi:hypothetical protein
MNLILWCHAEAEDSFPDIERTLTEKGRKQAKKIAGWLKPRLPQKIRILVSPPHAHCKLSMRWVWVLSRWNIKKGPSGGSLAALLLIATDTCYVQSLAQIYYNNLHRFNMPTTPPMQRNIVVEFQSMYGKINGGGLN